MSAPIPMHTLLIRAFRAVSALAGILLLLSQLLGPALASPGQSMWVEICSEAGAVWVQVDLEEGTEDPTAPCPKCADCALCAITGAAPLPDMPEVARAELTQDVSGACLEATKPYSPIRLWPETRGPPVAPENKTERAPRASMASIQVIGGAPWS